jgi:hypothetical protein
VQLSVDLVVGAPTIDIDLEPEGVMVAKAENGFSAESKVSCRVAMFDAKLNDSISDIITLTETPLLLSEGYCKLS